MTIDKFPEVSIVVIGKNEASNLKSTFLSILQMNYPFEKLEIIYVDSNSTDRSVEIAKQYTKNVFIIKDSWLTAAKGRNKGLIEANNEIVHFIDGDIKIDPNYIKHAVSKLLQDNVDSVYGFIEEKSQRGINNILLSHWKNRTEGYHSSTGAGGTYLKSSLSNINGYDGRIKRGEETDLGERFLKAGYKIWFINKRMGEHDYGIQNLKELINRYITDGTNKAHLHLSGGKSDFFINTKKSAINNLVFFALFSCLLILSIILLGVFGLIFTFLMYYTYFIIKYIIARGLHNKKQIMYFFIMHSMRIFSFFGQVKFYLKCLINKNYYNSVVEKTKN